MVKQHPKFFAKLLTPLLNRSLTQGIYPEILKEAIVIPVYKDGEKILLKNYRPLSIILIIAKIFEICVKEKMGNYLEHINFFADNQNGFMKGKSTDTALFKHISQIAGSVENNKVTLGVYLDLAKAFDTISHTILCKKLQKAGIRGKILDWFVSYLQNRKHRVKIGECYSL